MGYGHSYKTAVLSFSNQKTSCATIVNELFASNEKIRGFVDWLAYIDRSFILFLLYVKQECRY